MSELDFWLLDQIKYRGGLTCDECEVVTGGLHQSISSRIRYLAKAGYIRNSGVKRKTRTGKNAIVWQAVFVRIP